MNYTRYFCCEIVNCYASVATRFAPVRVITLLFVRIQRRTHARAADTCDDIQVRHRAL